MSLVAEHGHEESRIECVARDRDDREGDEEDDVEDEEGGPNSSESWVRGCPGQVKE